MRNMLSPSSGSRCIGASRLCGTVPGDQTITPARPRRLTGWRAYVGGDGGEMVMFVTSLLARNESPQFIVSWRRAVMVTPV